MNTITINGEQLEITDEQLAMLKAGTIGGKPVKEITDLIGKSWYIRTVTYHTVGRIVGIVANMFVMEESSWVADSGRFMDALKTGKLNEVEPTGSCLVSISSVVDMFVWNHKLPAEQK